MATRKKAGAKSTAAGTKGRKAAAKKAAPAKRGGTVGAGKAKPAVKTKAAPRRRQRVVAAAAGERQESARAAFRRRRKPETLRVRTITPSLTVADLEKSIEFYGRTLGFVVGERWMADGELRGVMLQAGKCSVGLSQDDWAKGRNRKKGLGVRIWFETVQDLDALAERIWANGVAAEGPKLEEWGSRTLAVVDPDGYRLTFTEVESRSTK